MKGYLSAATAATLLILPTVASAQSSGLASMHAQKRVGNKICMVDHYHNGSSSGERSRSATDSSALGSA